MRLIKQIVVTTSLLLFFSAVVSAQNPAMMEMQAQSELQKRGLTQEEVNAALIKNNINPDSIQFATPREIEKIQRVIRELETEKAAKNQQLNDRNQVIEKEVQGKNLADPDDKAMVTDTVKNDTTTIKPTFYGHQFINLEVKRSSEPVVISENYILGSGDVLSVSIWSRDAQFDKSFVVNKNGYIELIDARQRIFVKGMKLSEAREKIKGRLAVYFRFTEGDFNISLETSRKISVSIFGEVKKPGAYSFSATHNILDALRYTGGILEYGSVRNIKLIGANGKVKEFDLYAYLANPAKMNDIFIEDGDIIHVPIAKDIVEIKGAVRRIARFELKAGEGIGKLMEYAGGFTEEANKDRIQVERFEEDRKSISDINYHELTKTKRDFVLQNGDVVFVGKIFETARNFVVIQGEVRNPGKYERTAELRLSGLLKMAGLKEESMTDFAFLLRKSEDGTSMYIRLNLDEIVTNQGTAVDLLLMNRDTLTVWSKNRFFDDGYILVEGAIRLPGRHNYDFSRKMHVSDAILLAGGLARDASNLAFVHRSDPLKPNEKQYIRVNLEKLDTSKFMHENIRLEPYDRVEILSKNLFTEKTTVKISGPVNNPGEFQYGKNMRLSDLIVLAGGFKMSASTKNIEISRVLIRENVPTEISIVKVDYTRDYTSDEYKTKEYLLEPYDHVKVRYVPEFELMREVEIIGEVKFPGSYTVATKTERIADMIRNAGGLTELAFAEGATLFRSEDSLGYIVLNLKDALNDKNSKFNYILKNGDVIHIPKIKDFVTITGATKANEIYSEKLLQNPGGINVPFHPSKNASFYIKKYTGGIAENGSKNEVYVEHPSGEIEKSRNYFLFSTYPEVRKGSVIKVGQKPVRKSPEGKEAKETDWSKVISDSLAQAMTIFTLILLAKQASN